MQYLLITKKKWNIKNFKILDKKVLVKNKIDQNFIKKVKPKIIFFLHWSKKIHVNLYTKNLCIQFHCSNLPNFRGGSPVQNQILRGIKKTKLTAFKINEKIDTGEICLKKNLSLHGNVNIIYERIEKTAINMINTIIKKKKLKFTKQKGKGKYFKRRKKEESNLLLTNHLALKNVYDFIRMLDATDYPRAFINLQKYKIFFKNAKFYKNKINGEFKIIKK